MGQVAVGRPLPFWLSDTFLYLATPAKNENVDNEQRDRENLHL